MPDQPLMAVAGVWRSTAEWGHAFSMVMTDACQQMQGLHERMPVILHADHWAQYVGEDPAAAFALCRPYDGQMLLDRTDEPWAGRR